MNRTFSDQRQIKRINFNVFSGHEQSAHELCSFFLLACIYKNESLKRKCSHIWYKIFTILIDRINFFAYRIHYYNKEENEEEGET